MKQAIPRFALLAILVSSCSSAGTTTHITTPTNDVPQLTVAVETTATVTATAIPLTPTLDIENMSVELAAEAYLNGEVTYPAEWSDEQKHDLAIAIAEYLNNYVVADEAYIPMHFDEVGDIKIGWDPVAKKWRADYNSPEGSLDFTGESFPELITPGYTNSEGKEVIIDPETGAERVLEKINMPGLGEVSITELYAMGLSQLTNYTVNLMAGANGIDDFTKEFIESGKNSSFALPVILSESALQNNPFYHTMQYGGGSPNSIPEATRNFLELPTNEVLMPIFDNNSGEITLWVKIQQGIMTPKDHSFPFSPGQNPSWVYAARTDRRIFGNSQNHSFAILLSGKTTEDSLYRILPSVPFLENGVGIGDVEDVMRILHSTSVEDLTKLFMEYRLITLSPGIEVHQQ